MNREKLGSALLTLIETLRNAGYAVDVRQHLAAQNLLLSLASQGKLPEDLRRLQTLLGPILCWLRSE